MEKTIIVNENDETIGYKDRKEITANDIYRVSALWIENGRGQTLLAQRSFSKKNNPGKWGPAVAGTLEEGETYDSSIAKEAREEIGLVGRKFEKRSHRRISLDHHYFAQWYYLEEDIPLDEFVIQESEIEQIKWVDIVGLREDWEKNPGKYIASMGLVLEEFVK